MADAQTTRHKAYSYLRFSTPEQTKGDSFKRQTKMALEYAARHGLELDESLTFHDLGVSAYRGLNAEAGRLADFLEAVRVGLVPQGSFLLVEALDRLSRLVPRRAVRVLEDIVESGVTVVTLNDGRAYTAETLDEDPVSLLVAIVYFMRANEESATKSRRLKSAWENKRGALDTKPLTSVVPAWIKLDQDSNTLQLIPDRAELVRRIFDMYAEGKGAQLIAATLNREGLSCFGTAAHWHRTYIKKILTNPAAMGTFIPHRLVYVDGKRTRVPLEPVLNYYPPVVTGEAFEAIRNQAQTPAKHRTGQVVSLVAGLAKCPKCGSTMTRVNKGSSTKPGKPKLVCTRAKAGAGCEYRAVTVDDVEEALVSAAGFLTGTAPTGSGDLDAELERAEQSVDVTKEAIANLVSVLAETPSQAVAAKVSELEAALVEMETQRDHLAEQVVSASGPLLLKRLTDLEEALSAQPRDNTKANAMLRAMFERITVDYDHGALEMHWKHGGTSSLTYAWPLSRG